MKDERTGIGLALALVLLGLLAVGYVSPWWSYEESTGRQAPPDGPHGPETHADRYDLDFYANGWQGNLEPADAATASSSVQTIYIASLVAACATTLYIIGQIKGPSRVINRYVCMALALIATAAIVTALVVGWTQLPLSMAATGVDGPFTAHDNDNYIRTFLNAGWAAGALAAVAAIGCILAAYSAGDARPSVIEEFRAVDA